MGLLENRIALVTGAGRGIGAAIAEAFAREGASVAVTDVDEVNAQTIAQELRAEGYEAMALTMDVSNQGQVRKAVAEVESRWQRVDVLVNNAGICPLRSFEEIVEAEWDQVMAVNLKGAFLCSQAVVPGMRERQYGRIISIASVAAKSGGLAAGAHYAASKGGLMSMTFHLARVYAPYGVTANAIAPAITLTDMTRHWTDQDFEILKKDIPMARLGKPTDIASAALFLASDMASFITGEILDVNGGQLVD